MADEVELEVGQTVFWDDRPGWEGVITGLPTEDTLDVTYLVGNPPLTDMNIARRMFSVKA